ncbi:MAG: thioredoxin family protein [Verrucomicrobia bacterium]|jgi:thiol-disulfide isomerase/thioredoxin|nr:thioredoxin family protein [Verrucomicrobiota bacterium]
MRILTSLLACLAAVASFAAAEVGKAAPEFTGKTLDGKTVSLADFKGKTVVLEWYNPGCPFVKKFYDAGKMQEFQKEAIASGAVWLIINTGGHEIKESTTYYPGTVIQDTNQSIGRAYEAKVTPHCYVIDGKGVLVYKGAIDSSADDNGGKPVIQASNIEKSKNYVLAAVKAVKEGKTPEVTSSKPYGCGVKYNKL